MLDSKEEVRVGIINEKVNSANIIILQHFGAFGIFQLLKHKSKINC